MPFLYGGLYLINLVLYLVLPEQMIMILDALFYVSPIVVVCMLVFSRILRLCAWHRTACVVPLVPQIISLVDYYVVEFPLSAAKMTIIVCVSLAALLLVAAYNVFMK